MTNEQSVIFPLPWFVSSRVLTKHHFALPNYRNEICQYYTNCLNRIFKISGLQDLELARKMVHTARATRVLTIHHFVLPNDRIIICP